MANPELRIAPITAAAPAAGLTPVLITGSARSWLRSRRSEPFAACASLPDCTARAPELLATIEEHFRSSTRYTITTSLSRAVLAAHHELREENRARGGNPPCRGSVIAAAASERGVYTARAGPALVGSARASGVWARSADPLRGATAGWSALLGDDLEPYLTSEFFPIAPGDVIVLLAGVRVEQVTDFSLAAALQAAPNPESMAALLLAEHGAAAAGLLIWSPRAEAEAERGEPWVLWGAQARARGGWLRWPIAAAREPAAVANVPDANLGDGHRGTGEKPAFPDRGDAETEPLGSAVARPAARAGAEPATAPVAPAARREYRRPETLHWARLLPLAPLAVVLLLALILVRGAVPFPSGADQSVADAGRAIQEALATPDEEARVALLDEAIAALEKRPAGDESARALLAEARTARDAALRITHVSRVHRFILPETENTRPAGIWKTEGGIFILDLGSQILQRTDGTGNRIDMAWRPGDQIGGEALGKIVTAAWSPPRGINTEGQLLLVDHVRSITAIAPTGATLRRWWPPDNAMWQRLGPAAATHDDLFILDAGAGVIWRYPARLAGASATVAVNSIQEPRLASAVDMATDGNIYLLYSDGQVRKIAPGGGALAFEARVPDRPLRVPNAIYTHPDLDRVWVLEPGEARVVEFGTDGSYIRQFLFPPDMVRNAVGLDVDAKAGELRVLTTQHVLLIQMD